MLGIGPPGENWPFTLVGLSASLSSPRRDRFGPVRPCPAARRPSYPNRRSILRSTQRCRRPRSPLHEPGLPPGLKSGRTFARRQHWPCLMHIEAWFSASKVAASSFASPICCIRLSSSLAAAASDCAAAGLSLPPSWRGRGFQMVRHLAVIARRIDCFGNFIQDLLQAVRASDWLNSIA